MSLSEWVPEIADGVLAKNGFALLTDLEAPSYGRTIRSMEAFQAEFLGLTRSLWEPDFPIPGDALAHFSRQWEYPYAWANVGSSRGRLLDAGSGITFFPFLLSAAGFEVHCCDSDDSLGLADRYKRAESLTGSRVAFSESTLTDLPYESGSFDVVTCVSVLEHVGAAREDIVAALADVLKPGGRLVLTCDVDLRREGGLLMEDVSALLTGMSRSFDLVHPLDLRRPWQLLTSEQALELAPWRLPWPWRPPVGAGSAEHMTGRWRDEFRSIAILGITAKRADRRR